MSGNINIAVNSNGIRSKKAMTKKNKITNKRVMNRLPVSPFMFIIVWPIRLVSFKNTMLLVIPPKYESYYEEKG
jgi:hypothetical protein